MTPNGKGDRGPNRGKKNDGKKGPGYFEEAKALYERFRSEIADAADKRDREFLDFRLNKIVGRFAKDGRFVDGAMADDQLEMLVNAAGLSFGTVINAAILKFPAVFGRNADDPERRCHVRTMVRAMAVITAYTIADEESVRVAKADEAEKAAVVAAINASIEPAKPVAVEPADTDAAGSGS